MSSLLKKKRKKDSSYSPEAISVARGSDYSQSYYLPQHPETAPLVAHAISAGADPKILNKAKQYLGNQDFNGLCEAFVERATGTAQRFVSAFDAWTKAANKSTDLKQAKPGDKIYFAPDKGNGGYGHVGVLDETGNLISATYHGVKSVPIDKWVKQTGQKILGVVPS